MFNIQPGFLGGDAPIPETVWFQDEFSAPDGTPLANHPAQVGYGWTPVVDFGIGTPESIRIYNDTARKPTSEEDPDNFSGEAYYTAGVDDIPSSTYYIESKFTFTGFSGDIGYSVFGLQSPPDTAPDYEYSVQLDNASAITFLLNGNSQANSTFSVSPGVEHTLRIQIDGHLVTVKLDGITRFIANSNNQVEQQLTMYQFGTNGLEAFSVNFIKIAVP